jgi:hypothetical protein
MSLISQKDRQLAITAINHYLDFISSEIEYYESEGLLDDTDYQNHKSELPEVYSLLNWIKIEYNRHEH